MPKREDLARLLAAGQLELAAKVLAACSTGERFQARDVADAFGKEIAEPVHAQARDGPHAGQAVRPLGLEAPEVVPAHQTLPGTSHRLRVERLADEPRVLPQEGVLQPAVLDDVAVLLPHRVLVRAEALRRFLHQANADVLGQLRVDPFEQHLAGEPARGVHVGDLPDRVDPGVGAAAAIEPHAGLARDLADGRLDGLLHRAPAGLRLVVVKVVSRSVNPVPAALGASQLWV